MQRAGDYGEKQKMQNKLFIKVEIQPRQVSTFNMLK